jgi:dCMP deaminase
MKREDYISWTSYFMAVAQLSALRSKDPHTQVGACIVDTKNRIIGIGYNGFPRGCSDDELPWEREGKDPLETKYLYVCHAELNAITNASNARDLAGATIYTSLFPCNECTKLIIQTGIKAVVYLADKYAATPSVQAARRMLDLAGVRYWRFVPESQQTQLVLDLSAGSP